MDSSRHAKQGEVVVQVSGDDRNDVSTDGSLTNNSNESPIPTCSGAANRLPPKPPHHDSPLSSPTAPRRRTSFAKRKSRFDEQHIPAAGMHISRSRSRSPTTTTTSAGCGRGPGSFNMQTGTPKTPASFYDEEDDEEMEVYRLEESKKRRYRKFKVRVLIEWMILLISGGCLVASLTVGRLEGFVIWGLEIWKWCVMAVVVFCARLFTSWFVFILVFLIERNFLFKKKVLYFVYGLKRSFQFCIWFGLMLLGWVLLFNQGVERSEKTSKILNRVTCLLISLLVGSVIWLVKTLLVKLLASSFHVNRFFERIQESVFNQYVLQTLLGPPVNGMELGNNMVEFAKKGMQLSFKKKKEKRCGGEEQEGRIDVGKLNRMRREKVNAWTMKGLMSVISSGFLTISNVIDDSSIFMMSGDGRDGGSKDEEITNEMEAQGVGYRIFKNVAKTDSRYIEEEDLLRFLSREQVDMVFPLFEGAAETGKIRKKSLNKWVVNAYIERKSLALSLNDTKTAVKQVHMLASSIVIVLNIVISLLLMGFATLQILLLFSSQLVLVAFMFGNTCKTTFEAIIFVFVMHPFDVGDRCVIDGVQMTVEEMNILSTVFLRFDNEKIYYPNAVLSTKPITNFFRSPDMYDSIDFSISFFTSVENIALLKSRIKSYLESKPMHWHPNHSVVIKGIEDINKINLALYVHHTMNYQNIVEKNSRRTELMLELKKIFEDISIRYSLLPQDVKLTVVSSPSLPNVF